MMTVAEARGRLERMLAQSASDDPALYLSATEIADLLRLSATADRFGLPSSYQFAQWTASTAYTEGDVVRASGYPAGQYFRAGDDGSSNTTEPTWPATGATVVDSGVTWTAYADSWEPTWDLNRGAAEGWLQKAGKVAARYDFREAEGQDFSRSQIHKHCMEQHRLYKSRITGTVSMGVYDPYAVAGVPW